MMTAFNQFEFPQKFALQSPLRPLVGKSLFRDGMAAAASTVCVVTTRLGVEKIGRTVTSVMSLSAEPPTLLISIDVSSRVVDHVLRTEGFSIALLAQGQQPIADAFAGHTALERRFDNGQWSAWKSGHPRLNGALAVMDCTLLGSIETQSHVLFAGGVVDIDLDQQRTPLVWQQRQYRSVT
ncbi:flavin reductase family protein [Ochrobactrum sp. BTU1]|jgi:flavin reductase|uniref:flavin reductase family protein n=1 Tax=Ochrobactrum sp. BTU1 TaxID=2840456 RepID=UPI001C040ECA|nr:flavin reductase family protein [Ochrobactrum sp. BTU1]